MFTKNNKKSKKQRIEICIKTNKNKENSTKCNHKETRKNIKTINNKKKL